MKKLVIVLMVWLAVAGYLPSLHFHDLGDDVAQEVIYAVLVEIEAQTDETQNEEALQGQAEMEKWSL